MIPLLLVCTIVFSTIGWLAGLTYQSLFVVNLIVLLPFIPLVLKPSDHASGRGLAATKRGLLPFLLPGLIPLCFNLLAYVSQGWMQIGWDAPLYVYLVRTLREQGIQVFLQAKAYHSFLYELILAGLFFLGLDPLLSNILLPTSFSVLIALVSTRLGIIWSNDRTTGFVTGLMAATWTTLYRFLGGLTKSLFGLLLFLILLCLLFPNQRDQPGLTSGRTMLAYASLLTLAFVQLELAAFAGALLVLVFLVETLTERTRTRLKYLAGNSLFIAFILAPPLLISTSYSPYFLGFSSVLIPPRVETIIQNTGFPITAVALVGVLASIRESKFKISRSSLLISVWAILVTGIVFLSYPFPVPLMKFSERLSYFFPTPFLVGAAYYWTGKGSNCRAAITYPIRCRKMSHRLPIKALLVVILFSSSVLFAETQANVHMRSFIPYSTYQKIWWVSQNLSSDQWLVFVIYGGGWPSSRWSTSYMYDNWIGAIVGSHLTFVGGLHYLLQFQPIKSLDIELSRFSESQLQEMNMFGIDSLEKLLEHDVILIDDLYYPLWPMTGSEIAVVDELVEGVFRLNTTRVLSLRDSGYQIPVARDIFDMNGKWRVHIPSWTNTLRTLYLVDEKPVFEANTTIALPLASGNYRFNLSLLDTSIKSAPLIIEANGTLLDVITFNGTRLPVNWLGEISLSLDGILYLTFRVEETSHPYLLDLNVLEVQRLT